MRRQDVLRYLSRETSTVIIAFQGTYECIQRCNLHLLRGIPEAQHGTSEAWTNDPPVYVLQELMHRDYRKYFKTHACVLVPKDWHL